jgi:hypothetical protein
MLISINQESYVSNGIEIRCFERFSIGSQIQLIGFADDSAAFGWQTGHQTGSVSAGRDDSMLGMNGAMSRTNKGDDL